MLLRVPLFRHCSRVFRCFVGVLYSVVSWCSAIPPVFRVPFFRILGFLVLKYIFKKGIGTDFEKVALASHVNTSVYV